MEKKDKCGIFVAENVEVGEKENNEEREMSEEAENRIGKERNTIQKSKISVQ
jgi:hypothetical protein